MVLHKVDAGVTVITLLPNRSASWQETKLFILLVCGTTLAVGVFWTFSGAWVVLPFSGLEAALVAYLLYRVCHATYQRQVVTISDDEVLIQSGTYFPRRTWRLDRRHTHLAVLEPRHHLDAPSVSIFDTRHNIEVGRFLNRDDKEQALQVLKQAGLLIRTHDKLARAAF